MNNVTGLLLAGKAGFHQVTSPFLDQPGLPFANAISAADIEQAFTQRDALFATDAVFSTPIVLCRTPTTTRSSSPSRRISGRARDSPSRGPAWCCRWQRRPSRT